MPISPRQVVSVILLIIIAAIIIAPSLPSTNVSVEITGKPIDEVDHLYITVEQLTIHQRGARENSGLVTLTEPVMVDLAADASPNTVTISRSLPSGQYDKVILSLSNITIVQDSRPIFVVKTQPAISAPLHLNLGFGETATLQLTLTYDKQALLEQYEFRGTLTAIKLTS
ncbi:DUF4382 domain-containing protein [[Eubacterium] cellulosolvens]